MYYLYGENSDTADYLTRKEVEAIIKAKREHKQYFNNYVKFEL